MVKVKILDGNKEFLIKEISYKKARFNRTFRDKTVILLYLNESCKKTEGELDAE